MFASNPINTRPSCMQSARSRVVRGGDNDDDDSSILMIWSASAYLPSFLRRASSRRAPEAIDTSFNFLHLATHLHLQRLIDGLAFGVPPNSHGLRDLHPCGWFGLQAKKKLAAFFARQSTWYSLLFEVIVELLCRQEREKWGRANNEPREMGNNRGKTPL